MRTVSRTQMAAQEVARAGERLFAGEISGREVVVFNEEEVTEDKVEIKIRETLKLIHKVNEAHKAYIAYRAKFEVIGKRDRRYVKAKWKLARHRIADEAAM